MERDGTPIERAALHYTLSTGIAFQVLAPGMVPRYEEDEARLSVPYSLPAWRKLHWRDRAREVAHYRAHRWVTLHTQDAQAEDQERALKSGAR